MSWDGGWGSGYGGDWKRKRESQAKYRSPAFWMSRFRGGMVVGLDREVRLRSRRTGAELQGKCRRFMKLQKCTVDLWQDSKWKSNEHKCKQCRQWAPWHVTVSAWVVSGLMS